MAEAREEKINIDEYEWLRYKDEKELESRDRMDQLTTKIMSNPMVPIGMIATTLCLGIGLRSFWRGNSQLSQTMMRARVGAQGFTIFTLIGGLFYHATQP